MGAGRGSGWVVAVFLALTACEGAVEPDANVEEQVAYIDAIVPHHQIALMRADEALAKAPIRGRGGSPSG